MSKTQKIVYAGLLTGITVVLARFLSLKTDLVRISFEFFPIAVSAIILGPFLGGVTGALADLIGAIAFPHGAFFPGFTFSAFLTGLIYGFMLYKKPITLTRTIITAVIKVTIVDLFLVTLWLIILLKLPLEALLIERLIKCAIVLPMEIILIYFAIGPLKKALRKG